MKDFFDSHFPIPEEDEAKVRAALKKLDYKLVLAVRYTRHPDDKHLLAVIGVIKNSKKNFPEGYSPAPYTVWLFNTERSSLFEGRYTLTLPQALALLGAKILH